MPPLDVDALVGELRSEAEHLRAGIGSTSLPPLESPAVALARIAGPRLSAAPETAADLPRGGSLGIVSVGHLSALADPGDAEIHSHRARLGRVVVVLKKLLRRLLTPILDRQGAYNRAVIGALAGLERQGAENRAVIDALGGRLRELEVRVEVLGETVGDVEAAGAESFDYAAFEERFRGGPDHVGAAQRRYLAYFAAPGSGPVVDLGCGRGEFLGLLREFGVAAWGVERNAALVERGRAAGLDVRLGDLLWALESAADGSLGGITAFQVVEHMSLWKVTRLIGLARRKLRAGGCLVAETVNVASLFALSSGWTLDPTHRQPLHPLTLRFLVEQAGFPRVELVFAGEVDAATRLEEGRDEDRETRNARRLNGLVYAPQDYAVVAWA